MSDSTNTALQRAFELIEDDALEQAQELLAPLLETDADNPALWWVYSHAVRDSGIGRAALDRVLELDPSYPGARELNADLMDLQSPAVAFTLSEDVEDAPQSSVSELAIDDWEELQPIVTEPPPAPAPRRGYALLVVVILFFVAGGALIATGALDISSLLSALLPSPEPAAIVVSAPSETPPAATDPAATVTGEPPETAAPIDEADPTAATVAVDTAADLTTAPPTAPGLSATITISPPPTEQTAAPTTDPPAADATAAATQPEAAEPQPATATGAALALVNTVAGAISDFTLDPAASTLGSTDLGATLIIHVCAVPGPEFNTRLNIVMDAVVNAAAAIPAELDAVAAGLLHCGDPDANRRVIGVQVDVIQQFAAEEIEPKDFQRAWQPLS